MPGILVGASILDSLFKSDSLLDSNSLPDYMAGNYYCYILRRLDLVGRVKSNLVSALKMI